jgi:hypothetical protein
MECAGEVLWKAEIPDESQATGNDYRACYRPTDLATREHVAKDGDLLFPSYRLEGKQPRLGSMIVEDYVRQCSQRHTRDRSHVSLGHSACIWTFRKT